MKQIVTLQIKELSKRAEEQMKLQLVVRDAVKNHIVEKGADKKYGARPLKRAIQNMLEDKLAEEVLNHHVKQGDTVVVSLVKGEIKFSVK